MAQEDLLVRWEYLAGFEGLKQSYAPIPQGSGTLLKAYSESNLYPDYYNRQHQVMENSHEEPFELRWGIIGI